MEAEHAASLQDQQAHFNTACADKERRLSDLSKEETMIQERVAAMVQSAASNNPNTPIKLLVSGRPFVSTWNNLARFDRGILFELLHAHRQATFAPDFPPRVTHGLTSHSSFSSPEWSSMHTL